MSCIMVFASTPQPAVNPSMALAMSDPQFDLILTSRQAAELLTVSLRTLDRLRKSNSGPRAIQLSPGRIGFRRSDIAVWIASRSEKAG